jgi:hypothetical protein
MTYLFTSNDGTKIAVPEDYLTGMGLELVGYCLTCGCEHDSVEPDARKYPCEVCETPTVYGAQELMLMGRVS